MKNIALKDTTWYYKTQEENWFLYPVPLLFDNLDIEGSDRTMDVGALIKQARTEKGYTQEELAEKVGVKKSAVAKWENGRVSEIKRSNLKKLSEALGLNPNRLLGDIERDPISVADELADIYLDTDLRKMISEYQMLDHKKQAQVREYVHLLSKQG